MGIIKNLLTANLFAMFLIYFFIGTNRSTMIACLRNIIAMTGIVFYKRFGQVVLSVSAALLKSFFCPWLVQGLSSLSFLSFVAFTIKCLCDALVMSWLNLANISF